MQIKLFNSLLVVATLSWLSLLAMTAPVCAQVRHPDNAVWLGHAYVTTQAYILRSVSGRFWNNDATHPAPTNGVKVIIGFPAFPASVAHNLKAENIKYAAPGVDAGLNILQSNGDHCGSYLQGAGVFRHTDGTGRDNYANKSTGGGSVTTGLECGDRNKEDAIRPMQAMHMRDAINLTLI